MQAYKVLALLTVLGQNLAFQCPAEDFYGDPEDCGRYYDCSSGTAVNKFCPDGLKFNTETGSCDAADNVQCDATPIIGAAVPEYKVVCYYPNWAGYRSGSWSFPPDKIDTTLCTHVNYAFVSLKENGQGIEPSDPEADTKGGYYKKFVALKKRNPNLKVLLALGGWSDSEGTKYSDMVSSSKSRSELNKKIVTFLKDHGFDGLDVDWEYPACNQGECETPKDKGRFSDWMKELRSEFDKQNPPFLLSAAVSSAAYYIDKAYDVPKIAQSLDYINVMAYDYSNSEDSTTGQNAPFKAGPGMSAENTVEYSMKYWEEQGAPANKLVLGLPAYGHSFTLKNSKNHGFGDPAKGPGKEGDFTKTEGDLAYFEICQKINSGWKKVVDKNAGPYAYSGNQWVGYDDPDTIARKTSFARERGYGGVMFWDISMDDFNGDCCGVKNPLLTVANGVLNGTMKSASSIKCQ